MFGDRTSCIAHLFPRVIEINYLLPSYTYLMTLFFTPLPIFLAALSAFIVGFLYYAPFLFQKPWMKGEGVTKADMPKRSTLYMVRINVYSLIAHGCIAAVIAFMFDVVEVDAMALALSLGLLMTLGFIVSTRFIDMLYTTKGADYEVKNQIKFLVSAGYYITVSLVISAVLFLVAK